jgi:hypothetical protein
LSAIDDKIEQLVYIKFSKKLGKSATETHETLREAFREYSSRRTTVFEWHSHFKAGRVSAEDDECSGRPSTGQTTENAGKIRTRLSSNNPWARRHRWDQLWSLPGDLSRKFEHAPHCREVCSPTLDK